MKRSTAILGRSATVTRTAKGKVVEIVQKVVVPLPRLRKTWKGAREVAAALLTTSTKAVGLTDKRVIVVSQQIMEIPGLKGVGIEAVDISEIVET